MAYRRTPAVLDRLAGTRESILRAAVEILSESGYAGCTMAAVGSRAGVGTGTIYRFFAGKGELFAEVFAYVSSRELARAREAAVAVLEGPGSRHTAGAIIAAVDIFCRRAVAAPRLAYALIAEPVDPLVEAQRLEFYAGHAEVYAAMIADGIADGQLVAQDPRTTGAAIVGAVSGALIAPLARGGVDRSTIDALLACIERVLGEIPATGR